MKRFLLIAGGSVVAALLLWHPSPSPPALAQLSAPSSFPTRPTPRPIHGLADAVVYVAGAVLHPGLYRLRPDARAADAVAKAGGLRADADAARVNLAEHVRDGDEIFAPTLGEPSVRVAHRSASGRLAKRKPQTVDVVNINSASAESLATVPGIGRALAARIIEVRERDGDYTTLDELLDVAGMTSARLARAEPYLRI